MTEWMGGADGCSRCQLSPLHQQGSQSLPRRGDATATRGCCHPRRPLFPNNNQTTTARERELTRDVGGQEVGHGVEGAGGVQEVDYRGELGAGGKQTRPKGSTQLSIIPRTQT